jgi:hypothetical protein
MRQLGRSGGEFMRPFLFTILQPVLVLASLLVFAGIAGPRRVGEAYGKMPESNPSGAFASGQPQISDVSTPDFTVQISPSPLTIVYQVFSTGLEGDVEGGVTLTGTNGFVGQVDLSCSVTPNVADLPTCFLFSTQLDVDASGPAAVALMDIGSTTPSCEPTPVSKIFVNFPGDSRRLTEAVIGVFLTAFLISLTISDAAGRRTKSLRSAFVCCVALAMAGCGGQGSFVPNCSTGNYDPGTPVGTYMVTITATSGSITHTATVPLIVPPAN